VSWDNLQQRLTTDVSGGTAPDLAIVATRWLLDYATQGIAEPLDGYMSPEFRARFFSTLLSASTISGKTWGLPVVASTRVMYYNVDLLQRAGIAAPPATWDELQAAAAKIKAAGLGAYGFGLQGKEIETDTYWYYSLWTNGGELIKDGRSAIDSPAAIKAAQIYKDLINAGLTQPTPTASSRQDVESLFKQGRAAMILSGPWLRGQLATEAPKLNYGLAPIPVGTTNATWGGSDSFIMFSSSRSKQAAWKLLSEGFYDPAARLDVTLKEGFLPVTQAEAEDPRIKSDPKLAVFVSQLPVARFAPQIPNWEQISDTISSALQTIYLGHAAPDAALQQAAAKINTLLK
jgi:multiple sugar transport system substrate-binding protein